MATEVKLPRLGQGMESGTIVKWLKGEGEPVKKREPLYELDTDKVTQEVEAEADGVLLKIVVDSGEVEVGRTIAFIGSEGEDVPSGNGAAPAAAEAGGRRGRRGADEAGGGGLARRGDGRRARARPAGCRRVGRGGDRRRRRRARAPRRPRQGLAARTQARAREGDRHRDARRAAAPRAGSSPRTSSAAPSRRRRPRRPLPLPPAGEVEEIELTSIRKTIARRLTEAWQAPVFQLTVSVDMTRALELRERLVAPPPRRRDEADRQRPARRRSARPRSLRHPAVNAHFTGDKILRFPSAHVGIAVAAPQRPRRAGDPRRRPEDDPGDRRRPGRRSSAGRATASSSATTSRTARSRSRTSACSGSSSSWRC